MTKTCSIRIFDFYRNGCIEVFHHLRDDDVDDHDDGHHDDGGFHCKIVGLRCPQESDTPLFYLQNRSIAVLLESDTAVVAVNASPTYSRAPRCARTDCFWPVWKIIVFQSRAPCTPRTLRTPWTPRTPGHPRHHGHRRTCTNTIVINTFQKHKDAPVEVCVRVS